MVSYGEPEMTLEKLTDHLLNAKNYLMITYGSDL